MRTRKKHYATPRLALYGHVDTVTAFKEAGPADSFGSANNINVACPSGLPDTGGELCLDLP